MNVVLHSRNTQETIQIGKLLGKRLLSGDVIALVGELGTGKTHFIKGLTRGAGVKRSSVVSSPSFTLIQEYKGRVPFYHIDLYRLETEKEAEDLGLEEYLEGGGISAIEWADRIPSLLPKEILWIQIRYTGKHARSVEISPKGDRYIQLLDELWTVTQPFRADTSGLKP
jgi:tRNA threonylcarbamoyladenosine biosynthesis protein TsaE